MGFKSDREFLRNISIGAIGTRHVADILNRCGFNVIELERYSGSNKIWATKIKRLRVPDLLCLNTGLRIESRGKSKLTVTMSHAEKNTERAWDKSLRDNDWAAFICLWPHGDGWKPSDRVNLFRIGDMWAAQKLAKRSQRKSASEGSEVSLTWPSIVPKTAGVVTAVTATAIQTKLSNGRKQSYPLKRKKGPQLNAHVNVSDTFGDGDTVIASVMKAIIPPIAPRVRQYDFLADLRSAESETVYIAVKALGFLPALSAKSVGKLMKIMQGHADERVKLEAAASLARLGESAGWEYLSATGNDRNGEPEYRMETALILAELPDKRATKILAAMANDAANDSELRAAATWGLSSAPGGMANLLTIAADADEVTAVHAIVGTSKSITDKNVGDILQLLGANERQSAGLAKAILESNCDYVPETLRQIKEEPDGPRRDWLLYVIAVAGRAKCAGQVAKGCPKLLPELEFFWKYHGDNWTNRLDVADQVNFLAQQTSRPLSE